MGKIIAFYLPQFHPTLHNNEWWGEGFTEWTNVVRAKPLYPGHYQPKVPADLGFYDLRMPEVRNKQVELAKKAGVTGFCYYHYWFGDGVQELELPFNQVVESGEPDFPFMLCWANETWYKKFWNSDGNVSAKKTLVEQKYLGYRDDLKHFESLKTAFSDKRYIRIDGRLAFMIYKPLNFPKVKEFMEYWNQLAKDAGLNGFYFIAHNQVVNGKTNYELLKEIGFDAICSNRYGYGNQTKLCAIIRKLGTVLFRIPRIFFYKKMIPQFVTTFEEKTNDVYPVMIPNWDHSPRSKDYAFVYHGATPKLFERHAINVLEKIKNKPKEHQICFLKSWNEWGEGNYMEPDLKYGHGWINALRNAIDKVYNG